MRGQKLFVRPMEGGDADAVRLFLQSESAPAAMPESALVGKLVGNLVALLTMAVTERSVEIRDLIVAHDLRRKRIDKWGGCRDWRSCGNGRGRGAAARDGEEESSD
jgi:hypothetical protein